MFRLHKFFTLLAVSGLLCQPVFAGTAASPRLIPQDRITILDSGVEVDREIPAPAGALMACTGQCYIETEGMQLMGADGTVFAVQEDADRFSVLVREGSIDFALGADAKPVQFETPFDTLTASPYTVPAASASVIRGNLSVNEEKAVLTLAEGSLNITNAKGQILLHPGNAMTLAQYSAGSSSADSSLSGEDMTGVVVGAAALGIIGATIAALSGGGGGGGGDDGGNDVSPK
jgi:hypothetical protein